MIKIQSRKRRKNEIESTYKRSRWSNRNIEAGERTISSKRKNEVDDQNSILEMGERMKSN